jgi:predicted transcriptional regulator
MSASLEKVQVDMDPFRLAAACMALSARNAQMREELAAARKIGLAEAVMRLGMLRQRCCWGSGNMALVMAILGDKQVELSLRQLAQATGLGVEPVRRAVDGLVSERLVQHRALDHAGYGRRVYRLTPMGMGHVSQVKAEALYDFSTSNKQAKQDHDED